MVLGLAVPTIRRNGGEYETNVTGTSDAHHEWLCPDPSAKVLPRVPPMQHEGLRESERQADSHWTSCGLKTARGVP